MNDWCKEEFHCAIMCLPLQKDRRSTPRECKQAPQSPRAPSLAGSAVAGVGRVSASAFCFSQPLSLHVCLARAPCAHAPSAAAGSFARRLPPHRLPFACAPRARTCSATHHPVQQRCGQLIFASWDGDT